MGAIRLPAWAAGVIVLCAAAAGAAQAAHAAQSAQEAQAASGPDAQALVAAGRFREAEVVLRGQIAAKPQDRVPHAALAYCLLRENKPREALAEYTLASAIAPPDARELTAVGQAYVLLGDLNDADHWTLQATRRAPEDAEAWYSLGRIRYTEQRFGDAAVCFEHALALVPRSVKTENNLGLAYEGTNRTDDAVAAYRQAIAWQRAAPAAQASAEPLLNLGIVLLHRGQVAEAEPLLQEAASLDPKNPHIHEQLGQIAMQGKRYSEAAAEFGQASGLDPENSALHFLAGQALRRAGRESEAGVQLALAAKLARVNAAPQTK